MLTRAGQELDDDADSFGLSARLSRWLFPIADLPNQTLQPEACPGTLLVGVRPRLVDSLRLKTERIQLRRVRQESSQNKLKRAELFHRGSHPYLSSCLLHGAERGVNCVKTGACPEGLRREVLSRDKAARMKVPFPSGIPGTRLAPRLAPFSSLCFMTSQIAMGGHRLWKVISREVFRRESSDVEASYSGCSGEREMKKVPGRNNQKLYPTAPPLKEAQVELRRLFVEAKAQAERAIKPKVTFTDLVTVHLNGYLDKQNVRQSTRDGYASMLRLWLCPFFEKLDLNKITPETVSQFMAHPREKKLSGKSQKNLYSLLNFLFELARTFDFLEASLFGLCCIGLQLSDERSQRFP